MATLKYVRRAQTLLTEEQYALLEEHAYQLSKPISVLIREVIEKYLLDELERKRKLEALERLCSGDAPVEDWPEMERQIEKRWEGCEDE
ncbi:MAG: hypothetical protein ACUVV0_01830 [Anaerolineae bacterium]